MASKLKISRNTFTPIKLKISQGILTSNPIKIVQGFAQKLGSLYAPPSTFPTTLFQKRMLSAAPDPISPRAKEKIDIDVSKEEVLRAIRRLKVNKRPGPDGFIALFYKKNCHPIGPPP